MSDFVSSQRDLRDGIINNPMSSLKEFNETPIVPITFDVTTVYNHLQNENMVGTGDLPFPGDPPLSAGTPQVDVTRLQNLSASRAYARLAEGSASMLVTIAELHKSVKTMQTVLYKSNKLIRTLLSRDKLLRNAINLSKNRKARRRAVRELESAWMEARYGIRPMVIDVSNMIEALQASGNHRVRKTYRGRFSDSASIAPKSRTWGGGWYDHLYVHSHWNSLSAFRHVEVSSYILAEYNLSAAYSELENWGFLAVSNLLWELTPFSFILDWFWNTGDLISSMNPIQIGKVIASGQVIRDTITRTSEYNARGGVTPGLVYSACSGRGVARHTSFDVSRTTDLNRPLLPEVRLRLDVKKLMDLLIITKGLLSSLRKGKEPTKALKYRGSKRIANWDETLSYRKGYHIGNGKFLWKPRPKRRKRYEKRTSR